MSRFISPFRYPGGKSWLCSKFEGLVRDLYPKGLDNIIEPFCGGASISLNAVVKGLAKMAFINDIDKELFAFWHALVNEETGGAYRGIIALLEEEIDYPLTKEGEPYLLAEKAFDTLLKSRTSFTGGIKKDAGNIGAGHSRYKPKTLIERLKKIRKKADNIHAFNFGYDEFLEKIFELECVREKKNLIYADPPYPTAGERLYTHGYIEESKFVNAIHKVPKNTGIIISYEEGQGLEHFFKLKDFEYQEVKNPWGKKKFYLLGRQNERFL